MQSYKSIDRRVAHYAFVCMCENSCLVVDHFDGTTHWCSVSVPIAQDEKIMVIHVL